MSEDVGQKFRRKIDRSGEGGIGRGMRGGGSRRGGSATECRSFSEVKRKESKEEHRNIDQMRDAETDDRHSHIKPSHRSQHNLIYLLLISIRQILPSLKFPLSALVRSSHKSKCGGEEKKTYEGTAYT